MFPVSVHCGLVSLAGLCMNSGLKCLKQSQGGMNMLKRLEMLLKYGPSQAKPICVAQSGSPQDCGTTGALVCILDTEHVKVSTSYLRLTAPPSR